MQRRATRDTEARTSNAEHNITKRKAITDNDKRTTNRLKETGKERRRAARASAPNVTRTDQGGT